MLRKKNTRRKSTSSEVRRPESSPRRWRTRKGGAGRLRVQLAALRKALLRRVGRGVRVGSNAGPQKTVRQGRGYGIILLRCGLCVSGILFLAAIAWKPMQNGMAQLGLFRIKKIETAGNERIGDTQLMNIAGVRYNQSMFSSTPEEIEGRLRSYPWVKQAHVEKVWPDEVTLSIREYTPVALMVRSDMDDGSMVYIDAMGHVIAPVKPGDNYDFPVITGLGGLLPDERDEVMGDIVQFLKYVNAGNENLPASSVSEIHFSGSEGLIVRLVVSTPFPIYLGQGNMPRKYRQLREVLAELYTKRNSKLNLEDIQQIRVDYSTDEVLVTRKNSG